MVRLLTPIMNTVVGVYALLLLPITTEAKTCLMIYQVADNNLEYYLRQDFEELTNSVAIHAADIRTWVYHDAYKGAEALPNTVDAMGRSASGAFPGSLYLQYDPSMQKMKIAETIPSEVNSDLPGTIQRFLEHAMADCLAAGHDSLLAVFSSHGGGFAGFGGDEHTRHRKLLQTNANIAKGIRAALDSTIGAPAKMDVVGFDACLMQAVGVADDIKDVTKYILASESVEPGHGWAYQALTNGPTALDLSQDILNTYLKDKQGRSAHQTPKTMSIIDTTKFGIFVAAWEDLFTKILAKLEAGDASLFAFVSRARANCIAFEGVADTVGSQNPSSVDIGSFLVQFETMCHPGDVVGVALKTATDAYNAMFVGRGVGEGTAAGTGMHITWPQRKEYESSPAMWTQVLFSNYNYMTAMTPNYRAFLQWLLATDHAATTNAIALGKQGAATDSVCVLGAAPQLETTQQAASPDSLILTDSGARNDVGYTVDAEIAEVVSQVMVEYGLDLTTPLKKLLVEKEYRPYDEDYLYLMGGDVSGAYTGSHFTATWDETFYFFNISKPGINEPVFEAMYVFDQSDGSKRVPAMYFDQSLREEVANLQFLDYLFFDFDYWTAHGAKFSFLQFSVDQTAPKTIQKSSPIHDNLALFVSTTSGAFAELPPDETGGFLIPLIYVDAHIQGKKIDTLPGGFNMTVLSWNTDPAQRDFTLLQTTAENVMEVIPDSDAVVVNMYAYDFKASEDTVDTRYYDVIRRDKTADWDRHKETGGYMRGSSSAAAASMPWGLALLVVGVCQLCMVVFTDLI